MRILFCLIVTDCVSRSDGYFDDRGDDYDDYNDNNEVDDVSASATGVHGAAMCLRA